MDRTQKTSKYFQWTTNIEKSGKGEGRKGKGKGEEGGIRTFWSIEANDLMI